MSSLRINFVLNGTTQTTTLHIFTLWKTTLCDDAKRSRQQACVTFCAGPLDCRVGSRLTKKLSVCDRRLWQTPHAHKMSMFCRIAEAVES